MVTLDPLAESNARTLVEAAFGAPVDEALAETILTRTGGNPFFIEEVVRGLWESDVLVERHGRVMVPADYEPGAPPAFVMRYKTWVNQFSADPNILNTTFLLNDEPRTLIGMPIFASPSAITF